MGIDGKTENAELVTEAASRIASAEDLRPTFERSAAMTKSTRRKFETAARVSEINQKSLYGAFVSPLPSRR